MMTSLIFFISIFFGLKSPNNDHLKIFYGNEIRYYDQEFKLIKVKRLAFANLYFMTRQRELHTIYSHSLPRHLYFVLLISDHDLLTVQ